MTEFFEQLNGFVEDISDAMSRLTNYAALFQNNYRLNNSLEHLFVEVLQYFRWLRGYIGRPRKNIIRRLLIMHDLRESAQAQRAKLRHLCERTEKDAQLAAFEDAAEQQKQVLQIVQSAGEPYPAP